MTPAYSTVPWGSSSEVSGWDSSLFYVPGHMLLLHGELPEHLVRGTFASMIGESIAKGAALQK